MMANVSINKVDLKEYKLVKKIKKKLAPLHTGSTI